MKFLNILNLFEILLSVLDQILVCCDTCKKIHEVKNWELARTMIEGVEGKTAYRYVYLAEMICICGSSFTIEAQGYQAPNDFIVQEWHYRFFDCEEVQVEWVNLS